MMTIEQAEAIGNIRTQIRDALLSGADTRALRQALARLEAGIVDANAAAVQAEAERQHRVAQDVASKAEAMVAKANARLRDCIEAFTPNS